MDQRAQQGIRIRMKMWFIFPAGVTLYKWCFPQHYLTSTFIWFISTDFLCFITNFFFLFCVNSFQQIGIFYFRFRTHINNFSWKILALFVIIIGKSNDLRLSEFFCLIRKFSYFCKFEKNAGKMFNLMWNSIGRWNGLDKV